MCSTGRHQYNNYLESHLVSIKICDCLNTFFCSTFHLRRQHERHHRDSLATLLVVMYQLFRSCWMHDTSYISAYLNLCSDCFGYMSWASCWWQVSSALLLWKLFFTLFYNFLSATSIVLVKYINNISPLLLCIMSLVASDTWGMHPDSWLNRSLCFRVLVSFVFSVYRTFARKDLSCIIC